MDVSHNDAEQRFECKVDGGLATVSYRREGDRIIFTHTEVPAEAEGQGVGSGLARAALDYARDEGLTVTPACAFIAAYVKRHREYDDIVDT